LAETLQIAADLSPGPDQRIGKVKALMAAYDRLLMSDLVADPETRERNTGT
jgi:ABC-type proline/glycine betaine transport system ATPase subunit